MTNVKREDSKIKADIYNLLGHFGISSGNAQTEFIQGQYKLARKNLITAQKRLIEILELYEELYK